MLVGGWVWGIGAWFWGRRSGVMPKKYVPLYWTTNGLVSFTDHRGGAGSTVWQRQAVTQNCGRSSHGALQEQYFSVCVSPLEDGLCPNTETTLPLHLCVGQ